MARNQASVARRMREKERLRKRREKLAAKQARREEKAENPHEEIDDPMLDPTVDWGEAVREVKLDEDGEVIEEDQESADET